MLRDWPSLCAATLVLGRQAHKFSYEIVVCLWMVKDWNKRIGVKARAIVKTKSLSISVASITRGPWGQTVMVICPDRTENRRGAPCCLRLGWIDAVYFSASNLTFLRAAQIFCRYLLFLKSINVSAAVKATGLPFIEEVVKDASAICACRAGSTPSAAKDKRPTLLPQSVKACGASCAVQPSTEAMISHTSFRRVSD